jgi:hypothetical protein
MVRLAAFLGIVLHVLGALVAPGLHLHAHGGDELLRRAAPGAATCCGPAHAAPAPAPARPGEAELELPGHDEGDCALCAMAHWTAAGAPRVVELPFAREDGARCEIGPEEAPARGARSRTCTRGPPEGAS